MQRTGNKLFADEGMVLTDDWGYYKAVYLGDGADDSIYTEVPEEDIFDEEEAGIL